MTAVSRRVIVLGASNVTLGLPLIIDLIRAGYAGPLQLDVADSHGRSYGQWTTIPFRSVPGHAESEIWAEDNQSFESTHAIVTDIGNDLVYGNTPEQTANWVRQCVAKLRDQDAEIVLTQLPLVSLETLQPWRYRFFKTMFFPGSRLPLNEIRRRAVELNEYVIEIANSADAKLVTPEASWFGIDPIHVRRSSRVAAWQEILTAFSGWTVPVDLARSSVRQRLQYWLARPRRFRRFGRERRSDRCYGDDTTRIRFF